MLVFCAFQVVGFFLTSKILKKHKNGHVIHVPFLTKICFFPNELKPPPKGHSFTWIC